MVDKIIHPTTPEEADRIDALAALAEAERPEIIARYHRRRAAEQEAGLRGDLRRAITASLIGPDELASAAGVGVGQFMAFQEGQDDLPLSAFERLTERLGLVVQLSSPAA
jgi:hypothetical protein